MSKLEELVRPLIGTPWVHGGMSLEGFDCFGIVRYLTHHGLGLPLEENQIVFATTHFEEAWWCQNAHPPVYRPWDVLVMRTKHRHSDHTGLVIDDRRFVTATEAAGVCLELIGRHQERIIQVIRARVAR